MTGTISVVIPTYNDEATLCATVDSVLGQTRPADEIIIVDDASNIDLGELLGPRTDKLRIIRHAENRGSGASRNTGLPETTGDYVLFLDSDDIIYPDFLAISAQILDDNPHAGACFSNFHRHNALERAPAPLPPDSPAPAPTGEIFTPEAGVSFYLSHTGSILLSFALIRRESIIASCRAYGAFDPTLVINHDFHWFVRFLQKNNTVYVNIPMGRYLLRPGSLSSHELALWQCRTRALESLIALNNSLRFSTSLSSRLNAMRSSSVRRYARLLASQGRRTLAIKALAAELRFCCEFKTVVQAVLLIFFLEWRTGQQSRGEP